MALWGGRKVNVEAENEPDFAATQCQLGQPVASSANSLTLSLRVPCLLFYCRRLFTHVIPSAVSFAAALRRADRGRIWAETSSA